MTERAGRRRTVPPPAGPPFPRAVATWVGRSDELARAVALLDRDTLHLFYGVGGVGKSELVYKLVEEAQRTTRWTDAAAVVLAARPGASGAHLAAALKSQLGARRRRIAFAATGASADDDLTDIASALEAHPTLVFLDDLHHLPAADTAELLGFLSRHVRASRILVASRVELALPADTPPPVVHRLGPLDATATATLVRELAVRLGVPPPDVDVVFARSGGSPFFVLREVAGDAAADGGLDDTVRALAPDARALLLALATSRGRLSTGDAQALAGGPPDPDGGPGASAERVRELGRHLLVDVSRGTALVHDLVRDAVLRVATRRERAASHRQLAELHLAHAGDGVRATTPADAAYLVEAIHHLTAAGDVDDAWDRCEGHYRIIAAAGLDHLLIDSLRTLAGAVDDARDGIGIMLARILVRRSLIAEAADVLAGISAAARGSLRGLRLAGEVAQRRGRLTEAEALFRQARACAATPAERFGVALELADIAGLRGHGDAAREVLSTALADHPQASPRERARWGWSMAVSYLIPEGFAASIECVRAAKAAIGGAGLDDLEVMLVMLEVLARAECDDLPTARALLDRVTRAAAVGALREHVGALYAGVVAQAAGELSVARGQLERAFAYLFDHGDQVLASIAGYYMARVFLAQGDVTAAIEMSGRMSRLAQAAELDSLGAHGRTTAAEALLVAGKATEARALAEAAFAAGYAGAQTRRMAQAVLARLAALDGDLGGARRLLDAIAADLDARPTDLETGAARAALELDRASVELHGGDARAALAAAGRALEHYRKSGRHGQYARALVARAAALIATSDPAGLLEAEGLTTEAMGLATTHGHGRVLARCALLRGALRTRGGDAVGGRAELLAAVHAGVASLEHGEGRAVRVALGEAPPTPGQRALLAALGLAPGATYRVVGKTGTRVVDDAELDRVRTGHAFVIEPVRAVISCNHAGAVAIDRGRPLACELFAALVEAHGAVISAEQLFLGVWGGREYHPLRHRNTVYVAVKRLRQTLKGLIADEREIIETAAGGWRLADGVDAVVVRPVDDAP
ncbi:MAG: winged helix-turn-helix domain-containing protein [Myxococcales bacterium]|nr:winged helix-turn-helix domain-containing protein [Myxococcales bacterium]